MSVREKLKKRKFFSLETAMEIGRQALRRIQ
jgi:hypothetical protein